MISTFYLQSIEYFLKQKAHRTNSEKYKINVESQHLDINLLNTEAFIESSGRNENAPQ